SMTVFAARGALQLKVTRIDAEGDGLWRKAMELTLTKLRKEGLLDEARKRPIPQHPGCIAVVTSADGAALRDIVAVMRKRNVGARLVVCPTQVQGDTAALEIAAAIKRVGRWGKADVLIVGRGGGSKDDLWAFNDERVARAVAGCAVTLNALSPLATLARGYAVARSKDGGALTSARQFSKGLDFDLLLHDGEVSARAKEVAQEDRQQ